MSGASTQFLRTGTRVNTRDPGQGGLVGDVMGRYDVRNYGALGDGLANDTAAIQAAMNAAAAAGAVCRVSAGTYLAGGLTWPSGLKALIGEHNDVSILKRPPGAGTSGSILSANGRSDFTVTDICFDGDRNNQTVAANNITLTNCFDFRWIRCRWINARATGGGGFGGGIVLNLAPATNPTGREIALLDCEAYGNGSHGVQILRTGAAITIDGGTYSDNVGSGIDYIDGQNPPTAGGVPRLAIRDVRAERNGGGIVIRGLRVVGLGGVITNGHGSHPVEGLTIADCQVNHNSGYGIFAQARFFSITGNVTRGNGSTSEAGICANAEDGVIANNTVEDSRFFGIDAGGCFRVSVSGNSVSNTRDGIGINIGASQSLICADNILTDNGYAQIYIPRYDAGVFWFGWEARDITVARNKIIETRDSANFGILCSGMPDDIYIFDNTAVWPSTSANNFIRAPMTRGMIRGNRRVGTVTDMIFANAATSMELPEWADGIAVNSDTTPIVAILTRSQALSLGRLTGAILTDRGSGYVGDFQVIVSGGTGTAPTVWARVTNDGRVGGLEITGSGSGMAGTWTFDFSNGNGTGAAGTPIVGVPTLNSRRIKLIAFDSDFRITAGASNGTLSLPAPYSSTMTIKARGVLTLEASQEAWIPVAYEAPAGTIYPTRVALPGGAIHTAGAGTPEGVLAAPVGSTYARTDGGAGTSFYVKESGTGNTGWVAK